MVTGRERYDPAPNTDNARTEDGLVHRVLGVSSWGRGGVLRCDRYYRHEPLEYCTKPSMMLLLEHTKDPVTCLECIRLSAWRTPVFSPTGRRP
jgi:hypothetical protein